MNTTDQLQRFKEKVAVAQVEFGKALQDAMAELDPETLEWVLDCLEDRREEIGTEAVVRMRELGRKVGAS
jgi:hypothetical protein